MIRGLKYISVAAIGAVALCGTPARAQEQPPDPQQGQQPAAPIPAIRSPLASSADNGDETAGSQAMTPDTRSLTGAEDLSIGTMPLTHSYWQPHVSVSGTVDSNPQLFFQQRLVDVDFVAWRSGHTPHLGHVQHHFELHRRRDVFERRGGTKWELFNSSPSRTGFNFAARHFPCLNNSDIFQNLHLDSREQLAPGFQVLVAA